jgi:hypothetical protein
MIDQAYLKPTAIIDSHHPAVIDFAWKSIGDLQHPRLLRHLRKPAGNTERNKACQV